MPFQFSELNFHFSQHKMSAMFAFVTPLSIGDSIFAVFSVASRIVNLRPLDKKKVTLYNQNMWLVKLACEHDMHRIGTYVLFNYDETPAQFFERLNHSIALNKKYDAQITSFPMKFVPFQQRDRTYVSKCWNKRWLRGVQQSVQFGAKWAGIRRDHDGILREGKSSNGHILQYFNQ